MDHDRRERMRSDPFWRVLRWVVPWIALGGILLLVFNMSAQYREARDAVGAATTTSTVDATGTPAATGTVPATPTAGPAKTVTPAPVTPPAGAKPGATLTRVGTTLVAGIHLRAGPSLDSETIVDLPRGTALTILSEKPSWYQVRDPRGREGWVKSGESLIRVETR